MFVWRVEHTSPKTRCGRRQASLTYSSKRGATTNRAASIVRKRQAATARFAASKGSNSGISIVPNAVPNALLNHILQRRRFRTGTAISSTTRPRVQGHTRPSMSDPTCWVARAHAVRLCLRRITKLSGANQR